MGDYLLIWKVKCLHIPGIAWIMNFKVRSSLPIGQPWSKKGQPDPEENRASEGGSWGGSWEGAREMREVEEE